MRYSILPTVLALAVAVPALADEPPFGGSVYILAGLMTPDDPSRFESMAFTGTDVVGIWNHEREQEEDRPAFIFEASFDDQTDVTFHVDAAYDTVEAAADAVDKIAYIHGQMPKICRSVVETITLSPIGDDWSASPGFIEIDMGNYDGEAQDGALEESMLHECAHAAIDEHIEGTDGWAAAQHADDAFLTDYANENHGEDVAEVFSIYVGLTFFPERFPDDLRAQIEDIIPNRLDYMASAFPTADLQF